MKSLGDYIAGDTKTFTWVSSDASPTSIHVAIINIDETVVSSATMTSSGNGHYYSFMSIPTTPGFYVASWNATVGGSQRVHKRYFRCILGEVN